MRDYDVLWRNNGKHPSEIESHIAFLLQAKSFVYHHLLLIQFIDFFVFSSYSAIMSDDEQHNQQFEQVRLFFLQCFAIMLDN